MSSESEQSTSLPQSAFCSGDNSDDQGNFECNICFELAHDPIVTLCGHLYCWPCLYKWLHHHSRSQECPVCKALVEESKLVPLYGRGNTHTDPRAKSYPGINIPNRPAGQRPETASSSTVETNQFMNYGFGFGSSTLATAFGGGLSIFPYLFNIQIYGFPDATINRPPPTSHGLQNMHGLHGFPQPTNRGEQADPVLKNLFLFIGFFVILALIFC